jgi:hypothetical protein
LFCQQVKQEKFKPESVKQEKVKQEKVKQEKVKQEKVKQEKPAKKPSVAEKREAFFAAQPYSEDGEDDPTGDEGEGDVEVPIRSTAYRWRPPVLRQMPRRPPIEQPWPYATPKCGGATGTMHKCTGSGCNRIKTKCVTKPCIFELRDRVCQGCHEHEDEYGDDLP